MQYRILGSLEVLDDQGRPIPLGGQRERVLLAALLLEANRVVSADQLIEALWGDDPPTTASNTLQVHVSKLRKKLVDRVGSEGPLHTEPPGYVLRVGKGELDSERFENLATESSTDEDPVVVSARLADALALWRGRVLDGLEIDVAGRASVARFEELRVATVEARIHADLALGRHVRLVGELEGLVHTYPLRERLRAQLMVALYRSGRQADALAVYRNTRTILSEELGIYPSQALQDLELAILNQSPELDLPMERDLSTIENKRPAEIVTALSSYIEGARMSEPADTASTRDRHHENVAILFTDIVDSTVLSQSLLPEVADDVRRGHFSLLRQAVTEAGGTEVKNLGDGLMVVFASASAALDCGVSMQQGVERDNRDRENPVGLRVGLSGGEVTREDADYFGDPVVEAARLCSLCDGGQILATDIVRGMAGRRNRHESRSLGGLFLKGLPEPVETVEMSWVPLGEADSGTSVPLPSRLGIRPEVGVVGRSPEAEAMADAFKQVASGAGREVVLVSGEAGLGKTTLVAEASRSAFEAGACVLFGHCEEELATPYQLFAEALGHYVTYAPEDQLRHQVATHGSELVRLVPALASRIPDLPPTKATDSDTERYLLFAAVVGFVSMATQNQPVVLVLDDLQWADKGSLLLLQHLAASEVPMRLLVLGTYRDSELSNAHSLVETLGALRRLSGVSRLGLVGFDDTGVLALMEAAAGHNLDDVAVGLAHAIYRETDGNPFFVSEVLRNLWETGAIYRDPNGRWVAVDSLEGMALPDSVREVVGSRVVRLGRDAQRVLSVASVIGRDFDLDLLARATNTSDDDLLDILEAASAVALVREPENAAGRYNFAHALIQHTLYEDLGPNRRARAHRRVAEALEDLSADRHGGRVDELARHWFSATQPIDLAKAIRYSREAGDAALKALAPANALRYYVQALDVYPQTTDPDPVLGIDLAIGLGTAQRQTGNPDYRNTLLNAARRAADLGDMNRLVAAVLANNRGVVSSVIAFDTEKVEILEKALDRLSTDDPDRALVLATLCSELTFESPLHRLQALADEAVVIAETFDDDEVIVRVLNLVFDPLQVPPLLEQSLIRSADALIRAGRIGDPVLLYFAAGFRAIAAARSADIEEMDRCMEIMGSLAKQLDQPIFTWGYTLWRAGRALIAGETDQAERLATEAFQIGTDSGQPDATLLFGMQFMAVHLQRGTVGDLVPLIEQMAAEMPQPPPASLSGVLAAAHVEGERIDTARHLLEGFAALDFDLPLGQDWIKGMVAFAEAAVECRDPKYAGPLFDRLAPWAYQWSCDTVTAEGPVSHFLGGLATVLGRYDEADAYFALSAEFSGRAAAKFFAARTDFSWGRMYAERGAPGDIEKARDLLTKAQSAAEINGFGTVERRAAATLQELR